MNGITDNYLLEILGRCSIEDQVNQLEVICKVGPGAYKKHFLGLSDNVTYFVEQLAAVEASAYHYRVTFKPQVIIPDFDCRGDTGDGTGSITMAKEPTKPRPDRGCLIALVVSRSTGDFISEMVNTGVIGVLPNRYLT